MSNTPNRPDLDALGKLCDAATPGPWSNGHDPSHFDTSEVSDNKTFAYYVPDENNARFIAAARTALPALLADHARLVAEVATFKRERDEARSELDYPHRLSALNRENAESARVYEERWDAARAELAAAHAEHTRDAIASQARIAAEQDANRELRRDIERIREEAAVDRLAAAQAIREMGEMEVAHRTVEAERDAMRATLAHIAERGTEHDRLVAEVTDLRGSVESYMAMLDDANVDRGAALVREERIEAESDAEVARLRGLLDRVVSTLADCEFDTSARNYASMARAARRMRRGEGGRR